MNGYGSRRFFSILLALMLLAIWGMLFLNPEANSASRKPDAAALPALPLGESFIAPLPNALEQSPLKIALGKRLFHEARLSSDNTVSCASCHDLSRGGVDGQPTSIGVGGAKGDINAPTVFNSSLNFVQFWNGRATTLEEQAAGPIHNPLEMASSWVEILPKLEADETYRLAFAQAYPDGMTPNNVIDAIATFERTLITPNAPFDRYLRGENTLSQEAILGFQRFRDLGCSACHQGLLLGGNMYQKFGVLRDYFKDKSPAKADLGRFNVTGKEEDRYVFKVPSLRNVALTAPYFHDASAPTLEQAVKVMGRYQLGREISAHDVQLIIAFLNSLTGEWEGKPLQ